MLQEDGKQLLCGPNSGDQFELSASLLMLEAMDVHLLLRNAANYLTLFQSSNKETEMAASIVSAAERDLPSIDVLVNSTAEQQQLVALQTRRIAIKEKIQSFGTLKEPIRRIPDELLHEIFRNCLGFDLILPQKLRVLSSNSALVCDIASFSAVCYRWHEAIMNSPSLWTYFFASRAAIAMEPSFRHDKALALLKNHLIRSGNAPLSISLNYLNRYTSPHPVIVETLMAARERCRYLHLSTSFVTMLSLLGPGGHYPVLQHLSLDVIREPEGILDVFNDPPILSSLTLSGLSSRDLIIPWAQLRKLILREIRADLVMETLIKTTNIKTLNLFYLTGSNDTYQNCIESPVETLDISCSQ